nr:hypothetical protein [Tanacetum cinerariifolium]
ARSWSIPSEDPYEEAAQQLFEQAPHSLEYVPKDHAPASLLPPGFLSPRIRPLSPKALGAGMNAIASSLYHSLHPSGTPPLLPILLSTPSTSCRAGIPEADTPPQNRPLLTTPRPRCEKDRATIRAKIEVLRSERLAYEQEGIQTREAMARSKAYRRALEARVAVLETHTRRLEWQRQAADDFFVQHIMHTQALEAGARDDTLEDTALLRNSGGGDGSHSSHAENPRNMHTARPSYYADFMKCHPLNFKGTEGAVGLTCWIEKMETVFNISGCAVENQVKFATCTLLDAALTWWNSQIRTLGLDAYTMTWSVLKKKMTDKYCPLGEVKKLEFEVWNLKVRDNDILAYTNRFQEMALICTKFVSNETEKVDKYVSGLPDNIYGNAKSSKPKTLDETIENNQQPFKKQNVVKAYNMGSTEKKTYEGNAPKSTGNINATNNRGGNGPNPRGNGCFECGNPGHFKRDCPKLKNKDVGNGNAQGWVEEWKYYWKPELKYRHGYVPLKQLLCIYIV